MNATMHNLWSTERGGVAERIVTIRPFPPLVLLTRAATSWISSYPSFVKMKMNFIFI
jgi:hypothetical protein